MVGHATDKGMPAPNLTAALRYLEACKLITRTGDRREVRVQLNAAGRKFLNDSRTRRDRRLTEAFDASLTVSERAHLISVPEYAYRKLIVGAITLDVRPR